MPAYNPYEYPFEYQVHRVQRAVTESLQKLNVYDPRVNILEYLGVDAWSDVIEHLEEKRRLWNKKYPHQLMTLTNTHIDHIKPTASFKKKSTGMKVRLSNHFTNLQPLLSDDNNYKGSAWKDEDESFWKTHIVLQEYTLIYYPMSVFQPSLAVGSHM